MTGATHAAMVIGLGQIGMGYDLPLGSSDWIRTHAKAFSEHADFQLTCGVDPSPAQRATFSEHYNCPAYATIEEALDKHKIAVAAICTPTDGHGDALRKVIGHAALSTVICEKPLATSVQEAREMIDACEENDIDLYVNYMRRAAPGVVEVKRMIDAGEIAAPLRGVIWYSKGFIHNGSHFFDLASYWLGDFQGAHMIDPGRDVAGNDAEPEVRAKFANGDVVFVPAWEEHFSHYTVEVLSATGRLYWGQGALSWQRAGADPVFQGYNKIPSEATDIPTGMDRYQWHVADQLVNAMAGKKTPLCSGEQALKTLSAMYEILEMRNP